MAKPQSASGYEEVRTLACERVLVTLLRGLGPWKLSLFLVGGLTPRYLVNARPPEVPAHSGTLDIDVVVDLQILASVEAYRSLEDNLKRLGFERAKNRDGKPVNWRWSTRLDTGPVVLELLADRPENEAGKVQAMPTERRISALNIPYASMVLDSFSEKRVTAALIGENGIATETIRFADIVAFICLKALAFDDRNERKDAYDLVYCLRHFEGGPERVAELFLNRIAENKHIQPINKALSILADRFATGRGVEGYQKDGPVAVAKFEPDDNQVDRGTRIRRQRDASGAVEIFLDRLRRK